MSHAELTWVLNPKLFKSFQLVKGLGPLVGTILWIISRYDVDKDDESGVRT